MGCGLEQATIPHVEESSPFENAPVRVDDQHQELSVSQIQNKQGEEENYNGYEDPTCVNSARISIRTLDQENELDEDKPQLRPKDLEDLAAVFDRVRILHKKKETKDAPQPKKLIAKNPGKIDELAVEFDKKLTDIMQKLSTVLKDELITTS